MTGERVVVWEGDETALEGVADALAPRTAVEVVSTTDGPPWDGRVDCVVTAPGEQNVAAVRQRYDVPVVLFGDADGDVVRSLLAAGATDVVQAGGSGSHAVLAERIEQAMAGGDEVTPEPSMSEAVAQESADGGTGDDEGEPIVPTGEGPTLRQYAEILEALEDGVYALDSDGKCSYVNGGMVTLTGYDESALLGSDPGLVLDARTTAEIEQRIARRWRDEEERVSVTARTSLRRADGERIPCELLVTALSDDAGNFRGTVGVLRDVSERERRQELLTRLQETSRSLMQAPSRETVARIVVDAARQTLGFDMCVFRLYDADERTLEPVASTNATTEAMTDRPTYELNEGPVGEVFVSGEPAVYDDVGTYGDEHDRSPVRSAMYFPIGVHGALSIGTTEEAAFDDVDRQIATLLATNAAAACNRAKREREVRDARERIATILERINGLVEDTIEVLVQATTRAEVEQGVCEQLAAAEPYVFAWIARPDVREERLTATEWAGDAPLANTDVELAADGDGLGATAFANGDSRVADAEGMTAAAASEPWLTAAREAGVESVMALPLDYRGGSYGVLLVCSDRPDAFDDREQAVLEALGRAVANAINTVESGRILEADTVIELSIAIDGGDLLLGRLSAATGADLASAGTMTQDGGALRLFLNAAGADADGVAEALADDDAVETATLVAELDGESLFDVSVEAPLIETLVDHGAVPKAITAEGGVSRLTVELPNETAAREAFAIVEDRHPHAELVGYHERERPVHTQQEFRAALSERFTDRQETALRTAYLGGFFDAPRGVDGDELADGMGISRPTYHQHLRAAQRKVFEELFEADTPPA